MIIEIFAQYNSVIMHMMALLLIFVCFQLFRVRFFIYSSPSGSQFSLTWIFSLLLGLSQTQYLIRFLSLCLIAGSHTIHQLIEGLLPPAGIEHTSFKFCLQRSWTTSACHFDDACQWTSLSCIYFNVTSLQQFLLIRQYSHLTRQHHLQLRPQVRTYESGIKAGTTKAIRTLYIKTYKPTGESFPVGDKFSKYKNCSNFLF